MYSSQDISDILLIWFSNTSFYVCFVFSFSLSPFSYLSFAILISKNCIKVGDLTRGQL